MYQTEHSTSLSTSQVYRVQVYPDTDSASILPLGMECIESDLEGLYTWGELPEWMTDKIAVLSTLHIPPPPHEVLSVGKRISQNIFWVYR